jgi:uncharacterized DUF497 family protein
MHMKLITWDESKNVRLKQQRGVSFEDILGALAERGPLWVKEHPRPEKYPNQRLLGVLIAGYVFIVPFEETDEKIILKTVYPSRKATCSHRRSKRKGNDQSPR